MNQPRSVILQTAGREAGPVHAIPAHHWQAAVPLGAFALAGCTVAPGFEFADFAFLRAQPQAAEKLRRVRAEWARWL